MSGKTALVLGSSGLVGAELTKILLNSSIYEKITIFIRNPTSLAHEKLEKVSIDFDKMEEYGSYFEVDSVFCCLGTTIKVAKTKEAFAKVDLEYPLKAAELTSQAGKGDFYVVSAMGADENSKIFYNSVKGKLENKLRELQLNSFHIFRPSLLLGERQEFRFGEMVASKLTKIFTWIFIGKLKKYKPINANIVAMAMYKAAIMESRGQYIYESDKLQRLAETL